MGFVNVKIDECDMIDMLIQRVSYWTKRDEIKELYGKMYESDVCGGRFDGCEFDVMQIVDNDYVNWCGVVENGEDEFAELLKVYQEYGIGDCSCETEICGFIEAVDDEEAPTMFLVRY